MSHWYTATLFLTLGVLLGVLIREAADHDDSLAQWRMGAAL